jgi:hypothetical protein
MEHLFYYFQQSPPLKCTPVFFVLLHWHMYLLLIKVTRLGWCEHFVLHLSKWFQCHLFSSTWYMSKFHCIGSDHIMWKLSCWTLCKCQPCSHIFTYMSTRYLPLSHHSECNSLSVRWFVISPALFKCSHISTQIQQSHKRQRSCLHTILLHYFQYLLLLPHFTCPTIITFQLIIESEGSLLNTL